jgi:Arc/MetJ-type ribon-helix-helix transcriptional regulator
MRQPAGVARRARIAVRLSGEKQHQIETAAKTRGYANPSAFIRAAIRNELKGRAELTSAEEQPCARPLVRSRSGSNGTRLARKSGSGIARSDDDEKSTGRAAAEG